MILTPTETRRGFLGMLGAAAVMGAVPVPAAALTPASAEATIRKAVAEVYEVINSGAPEAEMFPRFTAVFARYGDVDAIARTCLGPTARNLPAAQFAAYRDAFEGYIGRRYGRRFREFVGGQVEVTGSRQVKSFVLVDSVARLNGRAPMKVEWHVSDKSGQVRFFNLVIEGVNLLGTERQEIGAMLARRRGDVAALTADLRASA